MNSWDNIPANPLYDTSTGPSYERRETIKYILNQEFSSREQVKTDSFISEARRVQNLYKQREEREKQLNQKSDEELEKLYNKLKIEEQQKKVARKAATEADLSWNQPEAKANKETFDYHFGRDNTCDQWAALTLGIKPVFINLNKTKPFIETSSLAKAHAHFITLIKQHFGDRLIPPQEFLPWILSFYTKAPIEFKEQANIYTQTQESNADARPSPKECYKKWKEMANQIITENPRWNKSSVADEILNKLQKNDPSFVTKKDGTFYPISTIEKNFRMNKTSRR